jgi:hypothetical protein
LYLAKYSANAAQRFIEPSNTHFRQYQILGSVLIWILAFISLLGAFSICTRSRKIRIESRLGGTIASLNYVAEAVGAAPLLFGNTIEIFDKAMNEKGELSLLNFNPFVSAYAKSRESSGKSPRRPRSGVPERRVYRTF